MLRSALSVTDHDPLYTDQGDNRSGANKIFAKIIPEQLSAHAICDDVIVIAGTVPIRGGPEIHSDITCGNAGIGYIMRGGGSAIVKYLDVISTEYHLKVVPA